MTRKKEEQGGMRVSERGGGGPRRAFWTLVIVAGILWVAAFFAVRTTGGLDLIRSRLEKRLGCPVELDRATLLFPVGLRLELLQSKDYERDRRGFRADEVRIRLRARPWWGLELDKPEINLVYEDGAWSPVFFRSMGELPGRNVQDASALCVGWGEDTVLRVHAGTVTWMRQDGLPLAGAHGVELTVKPVFLPDHEALFCGLALQSAASPDGRRLGELTLEWLALDGDRYVEITRSGGLPPRDADGFWGTRHAEAQGD
jgi:hypothetical protein